MLTECFKFLNEDLTNLNSSTYVINVIKSVQLLCGVHNRHWRGERSVFLSLGIPEGRDDDGYMNISCRMV